MVEPAVHEGIKHFRGPFKAGFTLNHSHANRADGQDTDFTPVLKNILGNQGSEYHVAFRIWNSSIGVRKGAWTPSFKEKRLSHSPIKVNAADIASSQ